MIKISLLRHGQTDWNIKNIMQGCCDVPLNTTGVEQAIEIGKKLPGYYKLIITSPLERAFQSAKLINNTLNLEIKTDSRLSERDFGHLTGMDIDLVYRLEKSVVSGIESDQDLTDRIKAFLKSMEELPPGNYLVVTHGAVIINILDTICTENYTWTNNPLENCSITELVYSGKWELLIG